MSTAAQKEVERQEILLSELRLSTSGKAIEMYRIARNTIVVAIAITAMFLSSFVVITTSSAVAAVRPRVTTHVWWPSRVTENPVCGMRKGERVCVEALPTGLKFLWTGYPLPKGNQLPMSESGIYTGYTNTGETQTNSTFVYVLNKARPVPIIRHEPPSPSVEYVGYATIGMGPLGSPPLEVPFSLVVGPTTNYIVNHALHPFRVGRHYAIQLRATGGAPYRWKITGSVPGLTLDPNGVLSGTPMKRGVFHFTVTAVNKWGYVAWQTLTARVV